MAPGRRADQGKRRNQDLHLLRSTQGRRGSVRNHPTMKGKEMKTKDALRIAKEIDYSDIRSDARAILDSEEGNDFTVDFGRKEYRFIHDDSIEMIHRKEIEELVDDCYLSSRDIPDIVKQYFDYDSFARHCRVSDGYGHHFAPYDGKEIEVRDWHVFRTN